MVGSIILDGNWNKSLYAIDEQVYRNIYVSYGLSVSCDELNKTDH